MNIIYNLNTVVYLILYYLNSINNEFLRFITKRQDLLFFIKFNENKHNIINYYQ